MSTPKTSTAGNLRRARGGAHSLHEEKRDEAIETLVALGDSDSARELIRLYETCQWRTTKLRILRALSRIPSQRSLEFLFRRARESDDLPLAEAAIWSLGQSHQPLAARFLSVFYEECPALLKPAVVAAVGQIPDRTLAARLIKDFAQALQADQVALVRNLVLTFGELKTIEVLPALLKLALTTPDRQTALAALLSVGRISRDPAAIDALDVRFRDDLFEYQLFRSVRTQVQFRSQWKLEDYLTRLFDGVGAHRALPYELSHFKAEDVKEGLKLFSGPEHFERTCQTLARLDFPGVASWYAELLDFTAPTPLQLGQVLDSISCHVDPAMEAVLNRLRPAVFSDPKSENFLKWLETAALAVPGAVKIFDDLLSGAEYRALPEKLKILALNPLANHGLAVQASPARIQAVQRLFEKVLESDGSTAVQARALRALAHLGGVSPKARAFVKEHIAAPLLSNSCLLYLQVCPEKNSFAVIEKLLGENACPEKSRASLLRALTALAEEQLPASHKALGAFLKRALAAGSAEELRHEAFTFLARHPRKEFQPEISEGLRSEFPQLQLDSVVALRALADPASADELAPLLESDNESLVGRALDALTSLPGLRAKRLVIDFLKAHPEDREICDKIIRCLKAPETPSPYFVAAVDELLRDFPAHPLLDGLLALRDRMAEGQETARAGSTGVARTPDITAIDAELAKQVPGYNELEEPVKTALRSGEIPYKHPEMFGVEVDKASSVLEYCKALDMVLERELGRRQLFPRIEKNLHEFQNMIHAAGLNESRPAPDRVLRALALEKHFTAHSLPLHKMSVVASAILSGRIVHESFRTLDGLRAWSIMLLLFARRVKTADGVTLRPLINLSEVPDDTVISFCKRLNSLQDLRNPAAHRQTYPQFLTVDTVRGEVFQLLQALNKILPGAR